MNLPRLCNTEPIYKKQLYLYILATNNQNLRFLKKEYIEWQEKYEMCLGVNLTKDMKNLKTIKYHYDILKKI